MGQKSDSTQTEKLSMAVYPAFGFSPETRWNFGAIGFFVLNQNKTGSYNRPTAITPYIIFTSRKQLLVKSEFDIYRDNGDNFNLNVRYFNFPDKYFGIGNTSKPDYSTSYIDQFVQAEGKYMKRCNKKLFIGVLFDIQYNQISYTENQTLFLPNQNRGIHGGRNAGLGLGVQYDTRNSTLYPTVGRYIQSSIIGFHPLLGGEYQYLKYTLDYRRYMELLNPKNIIALQFKTELTYGEVPFYKLPRLGGDERLRGIVHHNLYRDQQSTYLQIEVRQKLVWRLGAVLFAGVGKVCQSFFDVFDQEPHYVYGLGGRFQAIKDQKLNIRLDLGFTHNGQHALYLSVKEAF